MTHSSAVHRSPRALAHRISTRIYGPRRGCGGHSWIGDERLAIGGVPVGGEVWRLPDVGITHVVNCRATLQTRISQDLWAEKAALGGFRVVHAPMWDTGRPQPADRWADAVEYAAAALGAQPDAGVLIHCQQGRRRSAMVAYGVLRLRGHDAVEASRLILHYRPQAELVPAYTDGVERWLSDRSAPLP